MKVVLSQNDLNTIHDSLMDLPMKCEKQFNQILSVLKLAIEKSSSPENSKIENIKK